MPVGVASSLDSKLSFLLCLHGKVGRQHRIYSRAISWGRRRSLSEIRFAERTKVK